MPDSKFSLWGWLRGKLISAAIDYAYLPLSRRRFMASDNDVVVRKTGRVICTCNLDLGGEGACDAASTIAIALNRFGTDPSEFRYRP